MRLQNLPVSSGSSSPQLVNLDNEKKNDRVGGRSSHRGPTLVGVAKVFGAASLWGAASAWAEAMPNTNSRALRSVGQEAGRGLVKPQGELPIVRSGRALEALKDKFSELTGMAWDAAPEEVEEIQPARAASRRQLRLTDFAGVSSEDSKAAEVQLRHGRQLKTCSGPSGSAGYPSGQSFIQGLQPSPTSFFYITSNATKGSSIYMADWGGTSSADNSAAVGTFYVKSCASSSATLYNSCIIQTADLTVNGSPVTRCLDVFGGVKTGVPIPLDAKLDLWDCNGSLGQKWTVQLNTDCNSWLILPASNTTLQLNIKGNPGIYTEDGAQVLLYKAVSSSNNKWLFFPPE